MELVFVWKCGFVGCGLEECCDVDVELVEVFC